MTKKRIYGEWAGNPKGQQEDLTRCIESVMEGGRGCISYQCQRKRGHGKAGLYCKIHDPEYVAQKSAERKKKWDAEMASKQKIWDAPAKVKKLEKKLDTILAASKKALIALDALISYNTEGSQSGQEASDELHAAILRCEK